MGPRAVRLIQHPGPDPGLNLGSLKQMIVINIPVQSMSKPAGTVYNGRISMDKRGYGAWKALVQSHLQEVDIVKGLVPYGWVIIHHSPLWNHGDLLNHVNATMDTLVRRGVIKDDRPKWVNRCYTAFTRQSPASIDVYICMNREEMLEVICELA